MLKPIRASIVILLLMTVLTGLAYPLAMTGAAGAIFPDQAAGSWSCATARWSAASLIGQGFAEDRYFHGRPSAAGDKPATTPPLQRLEPRPDLEGADRAGQGRCREAEAENGARCRSTSSPPRPAASIRISRRPPPPGRCRGSPRRAVCRRPSCSALVGQYIEGRDLGFLGEPRVNVLRLNLALDALAKR